MGTGRMHACRLRCAAHSSSCLKAASLSLLSLALDESGRIHGLIFPTICKSNPLLKRVQFNGHLMHPVLVRMYKQGASQHPSPLLFREMVLMAPMVKALLVILKSDEMRSMCAWQAFIVTKVQYKW